MEPPQYVLCMTEKKKTLNKPPMGFTITKNNRIRFYCKCANCGENKSTILGMAKN